ncbi:proteasome activator [Aeromicrobium sp. UC242_57]|uniref:proteasome activator n=1 Tax=Aeromicrobium sp. UC242_57 TaxID=3374624 RepID=UPI00378B7792
MSEPQQPPVEATQIIGPDGQAVSMPPQETELGDLVAQPAKVMRIGGMIRHLLDEVKAAPLDEASRARLRTIHLQSIEELKDGLAPELVDELERLSLPFDGEAPSEGELRIAQAQPSAGSRGCSTASRRRSTRSRSRLNRSFRT